MSVLFVGDLHLADSVWPSRPIYSDSYYVLPQIFSTVKKRKIKVVVLCGDVIDRKRTNSRPIKLLRQFIANLRSVGAKVYFVQGQHDMSEPPWCTVCGAEHLEDKVIDLGNGHMMTGMDWVDAPFLADRLKALPKKANLLVCHQMWAEFKPFGPEPDGSLADVPLHITTVVSGDIHRSKQLTIDRGNKKHRLRYLSPGSTSMQDIVEDEVKRVWLWETDGTFTAIRLRGRTIIRTKTLVAEKHVAEEIIRVSRELDDYKPRKSPNPYQVDLNKPIVDVRFSKDLTDVETRFRQIVRDRAFLHFRYFVAGEDDIEQFQSSVDWKSRAIDAIQQALAEETQDPEELAMAKELLGRRERTDEKLKPILNRYIETGSCT